jgi:hypothetical protein
VSQSKRGFRCNRISVSAWEQHLRKRLRGSISRRTLSRRLSALLAADRIHRVGSGPSTRYVHGPASGARGAQHLAVAPARDVQGAQAQFETQDGFVSISLSQPARTILEYVSRPVAARTPCGYERRLLDDYVPNVTSYIPDKLRARLHKLGKPIVAARAAGTFARDILGRFLIDLSWASSRLEGNTYSRLDTERLIQFGHEAEGKDAKETQMILNHKAAIELLVEESGEVAINRFTLLNLHALLSDNLMADPEASGRLRRRPVDIGGSIYTPPAVPQLVEDCFAQITTKATAISDPFERAFFAMVHLPYLQPFEDVDKRVSRLAANIPLIQADLCPLSFVDVPARAYIAATMGVDELARIDLLRDVFAWAYERSCLKYVVVRDSIAEPDRFRMKYRDALTEVIGRIVRAKRRATKEEIRRCASRIVEERDMPKFVELTDMELRRLNEGNIARYRVRLSEYRSWRRPSR